MSILLGYKKGLSKKGNEYCSITLATEYSAKAQASGSVGSYTRDSFLPVEVANTLTPKMIGKNVRLNYQTGEFGYPVVCGIEVI